MHEVRKVAAAWQLDDHPGPPYQTLILGRWQCCVRTEPRDQGYLWAVTSKTWFGNWQHDGGFAPSVAEAMFTAELVLEQVSGLKVT